METRRKAAEAQRLRQEEEDRRAALVLQAQMEKEAKDDAKYRQQLEQERRDHELALRLASESNGQVEDSPPVIRKYVTQPKDAQIEQNFSIGNRIRHLLVNTVLVNSELFLL